LSSKSYVAEPNLGWMPGYC